MYVDASQKMLLPSNLKQKWTRLFIKKVKPCFFGRFEVVFLRNFVYSAIKNENDVRCVLERRVRRRVERVELVSEPAKN
jgi:hypothetical protein